MSAALIGDVQWIGWCVWAIVALAIAALAAREWQRTTQHGALVFLLVIYGCGLAVLAALLAIL